MEKFKSNDTSVNISQETKIIYIYIHGKTIIRRHI